MNIRESIEKYRFDRQRDQLIRHGLYSLGAVVAAVLLILMLSWILGRVNNVLQRRIRSRIESVEDKSFNLIRSAQIWRSIHLLFSLLKTILFAVVVMTSIVYSLSLFPWTRGLALLILDSVLDPVYTLGRDFLGYLPKLVFLVIIFFVTRYILKLFKLFFSGVSESGIKLRGLDPELALPTYRIVRLLVIVFALVVAYPYIPGSDSQAFKGISVFLGVLFSLGSSSFIGNLIAGYAMTFRKAFRPGDRILVDGHVGFVEEQRAMVTRIRTLKNEEIVIPNSTIINSSIVNYSTKAKETGIILHANVGIGYETPWRQVDGMLLLAANRTKGLLKEPPPFVLKKSLGDFAVDYEINAYCKDAASIPRIYNDLFEQILDIFNENDIQIMTPAYKGDPEIPKVVPRDQWHTPVAGAAEPDATTLPSASTDTLPDPERL